MKKTLVTLLAASTLAAAFVPAFANSNVSTSGNSAQYTDARKAKEAKEEAARKAAAVQATVNAERAALATYNKALEAHNTVVARFQDALNVYEAAKIEADNVRKNVSADLAKAHAELKTNRTDAIAAYTTKSAELAGLNVAGLKADADQKAQAAQAAADAVAAHKLTAPVEGSADAVVKAYNDTLAGLEKAAAEAADASNKAAAKHAEAAAKETPLALELEKIKALVSDIEFKLNTETIEDNAAVKAANAKLADAHAKLTKIAAEMPTTRANLDAAKAALDKAIEANKEAHYQAKLAYNAPEVAAAAAAAAAAEKKANELNGGAAAGKAEANKVAAAKTATGQKALPKTSAAK